MRSVLSVILVLPFVQSDASAQKLTEANYDSLVPAGKEVDAIYGDYALKNTGAKAVIAAPLATRNANMTVRDVGGSLLDFAVGGSESDQLSAFYPGRRKFPFREVTADDRSVTMTSPGSSRRPKCDVKYEFTSDQPIIDITSTWTNTTSSDWTLRIEDDIRADSGKEDMTKASTGTHDRFWFHDIHWGQAYVVIAPGYRLECTSGSRDCVIRYVAADGKPVIIKPNETFSFARRIVVAKDLPTAHSIADGEDGDAGSLVNLELTDRLGSPITGARVKLGERGTVVTDQAGNAVTRLPIGDYTIDATVAGVAVLPKGVTASVVKENNQFDFQAGDFAMGVARVSVVDGSGDAIPAKVEFIGGAGTPTPNWGPETAEHFVRNVAYTADGMVNVNVKEGSYDLIVSRGPEYDAVFTTLTVEGGKTATLKAELKHSVKTPGWVSSDFHSHSSPSGDNTGSQLGRVLNLAAENVEFAPCTEHNRVSTYEHHIAKLKLNSFLATVTGMELTGSPLPLNHQNVFPMKYTPRTQDGGGPVTDSSPETQVERIALWDNRSEKLIQQNHPDIGWLFYDKNGDRKPDKGYSRSFEFMDVMEIHPIDRILDVSQFDIRNGKPFNNQRMLNWLQLLNQGFRIYGVVNTDSHYNFHGSGWLRNWIQSSTDDPAKIDSGEMVKASEEGRLIMSNGPYLEATFTSDGKSVVSGQDIAAKSGKVDIKVKVQCANWLDVDQVFVLVNGKQRDELTFTRSATADKFSDDVVKFDQTISVTVKEDSHLIVVTGHSSERLGDVMGPTGGQQHPAALTNPVFVDVDGDGFTPNKDTLGYPLPVKFKAP